MALIESSNQYKHTGKGPLDKKALVATYAELLTWDTWVTNSGSKTAYNTMIVGVWANKEDPSKNGIYYLFDPACTSTIKNPDVTNAKNWHKIAEATDLGANFEELASKVQILDVTVNGSEEQEGLVDKVAKNTTDIAEIKAAGYMTADTLAATLEPYAKTSDIVTIAAFNEFKTSNDAAILEIHNEAAAIQLEVNEIKSAVDSNTAKLAGITTTVLDVIEDAVAAVVQAPATDEKLGSIKSGSGDNIVSVDEEGLASVKFVNVNSLTQDEGDILILNGGSNFAL
jgi:hypothetical protein